jgi:hypothetical protein
MQGAGITLHGPRASCSGRLAFSLGPLSWFRPTQGMVQQANQPAPRATRRDGIANQPARETNTVEQPSEAGLTINMPAEQPSEVGLPINLPAE